MVFGAVLRLLRVDAGTSLRELAATIGVSSAYLSRVENGHDPAPTPDRLMAIAMALGVSPSLLVELAERVEPAVAQYLAEVPSANRFFLEVVRRRLTAAQIGRLLALLEAEFPTGQPIHAQNAPPLYTLLSPDRILLGVHCTVFDDVLDLAASRLALAYPGTSVASLAKALRVREASASTALGGGLSVPHTHFPGGPPAAALITLATPLSTGPDGLPIRVALVLAGMGDRNLVLLPRIALLARADIGMTLAGAMSPEHAIHLLQSAEHWISTERL